MGGDSYCEFQDDENYKYTPSSSKTKPIIFLDIDGPICTERAYLAYNQNKHKRHNRAWDPIALRMISNIAEEYNAEVVISSTWRTVIDVRTVLESHGFNADFHLDWKTPEVFRKTCKRSAEIDGWLYDHQGEVGTFLIIDDLESGSSLQYHDELKDKTVFVDSYEGFSSLNYHEAKKILDKQLQFC